MKKNNEKKYRKFFLRHSIVIFVFCLSLSFFITKSTAIATTFRGHSAPKLVNYFLRWDLSESEALELSKWDIVVLDMEIQHRAPHLLKKMRQWNPDIVLLVYITPQEIKVDAINSYSIMRRRLASGIADAWYLKNTNGMRLSWWEGTYLLNMTNKAPIINGNTPQTFIADFVTKELLYSGYWDGVFYDNSWDNITHFAGTNIDLNNDGVADGNLDTAWLVGMKTLYEQTRFRVGDNILLVGNNDNGAYLKELNGKLLENFSLEKWSALMNIARILASEHKNPRVSLINSNTKNTGYQNYKNMRFGLTSALLENMYFSYDYGDSDHGQIWWYDEYDINLGLPITKAQSKQGFLTYQQDIWHREFEHGIALVNSTDKKKIVDLGREYEHIAGTQDPVVNDGSIVSELSIAGADGRILLKTFETLQDVLFENGDFVRFLRPDGSRARNGFFVFDDDRKGGDQVARIDLNGDGLLELFVVSKNKIMAWRNDGQPFINPLYPYTANYDGKLRVLIGDINNDNRMEIYVAPEAGYPAPIKVYTRYGYPLRDDWFPFGESYKGGYTLALGSFEHSATKNIILGSGVGIEPRVGIYTWDYKFLNTWLAFEKTFKGGVNVASGDLDGDGIDEIVVGAGSGKPPIIRTFYKDGSKFYDEFQAYSSISKPGIVVRTQDVDFDGKDDILGFSSGF